MLRPKKAPNGKFGYVDANNEWVIKPMYESVQPFYNDYVAVATLKKGRSILINEKNENVTGKIYSKIEHPSNGYLIVHELGLEGILDDRGNEVAEAQEMYIIEITSHGTAPIMQNDKYGVINLKTRKKVACSYESMIDFVPGSELTIAKKDGKFGAINWDDAEVVPFIYDSLCLYSHLKVIVAKLGEKEGLINMQGQIIYPFDYDDILVIGGTIELKKVEVTLLKSPIENA